MLDDAAAEAWRDEQRATYTAGDSARLAERQRPTATHLVETADLGAGDRVLDIGAGTGNVAVEAARRGAAVAAVDITPRQVAAGQARCDQEGVAVDWQLADAERLPFPDGSFDVVLSSFGIVYAARPDRAAAEVLRVLDVGGRALFTAFPRDSFNGSALEAVNRYQPGGEDVPPVDEYLWSEPESLTRWFGDRTVEVTRHARPRDPLPSLEAWWESVRGIPIVERLHATLPPERLAALRRELTEILAAHSDVHADGSVQPYDAYVIVRIG